MEHCYGTIRFTPITQHVNERKCGHNKFTKLAPAKLEFWNFGASRHQAMIRLGYQHSNFPEHSDICSPNV